MTTSTAERTTIRELAGFTPKQGMALDALYSALYVLFGGAAGPGKSYWLRWAALHFLIECAMKGLHDVRVGLFCEDYPTLADRQISRIKREFPSWLGTLRGTREEGYAFFLRPEYGGGYIALRNLDDPSKYASTEFAAIFVDELTKNDRQTFEDLRFRLRWPGLTHSPFAAATNPGSKGHGWVKKLWIDQDFTGDMDSALDPEDFAFVQALPSDNAHLPDTYWKQLDSLNPRMRRAMRDGLWDVFEGQGFPEFDRKVHVIEPFTIPADWTRWTSTDYGYVDPWGTVWLARSPDRTRVVAYREGYATGLTAREQARKLLAMTGDEPIRLHLGDPSMWAMRERYANESISSEYAAEGVALQPANNDRLGGKAKVHEALRHDHGVTPRLHIFRSCPNLIRTLENIPLSETRPEDVDTHAEDHLYDCLRYGLEVEGQRADPPATMRTMQIVGDEPREAPRTIRAKIDAARKPVEQYGPKVIR